jgi:hypothetical protein
LNDPALFRLEAKTRADGITGGREVKSRWVLIAVQEKRPQEGELWWSPDESESIMLPVGA